MRGQSWPAQGDRALRLRREGLGLEVRGTDPRGSWAGEEGVTGGSPSHFSNLSTRGLQPSCRRNAPLPTPSTSEMAPCIVRVVVVVGLGLGGGGGG